MSEHNKTLVRRFYEEVENQGNLEVVDELVDPRFRDVYNTGRPVRVEGLEGVKQLVTALRSRGDFHLDIEELIAEDDKVVARLSSNRIIQTPAGDQVKSQLVEIFRIANGKLVERWVFIDRPPVPAPTGTPPASS
jgi:predicted ester cyclase